MADYLWEVEESQISALDPVDAVWKIRVNDYTRFPVGKKVLIYWVQNQLIRALVFLISTIGAAHYSWCCEILVMSVIQVVNRFQDTWDSLLSSGGEGNWRTFALIYDATPNPSSSILSMLYFFVNELLFHTLYSHSLQVKCILFIWFHILII